MAIESYFFNAIKTGDGTYDRTYNAQDITNYLNLLVGNGVFPNPSTQLQVISNTGMKIAVKNGSGWIDGHKIVNTSDLLLAVDTSDVILNRIDSVVFYADHTARTMGIKVKKGTPASNPVAPQVVRDTNIYEMQLATVSVSKQVTTITQSMITDTRGHSDVCGYVQGLIQQVGTQTLFTQWQTAYLEAITKDQSDFDAWFTEVKEHLASATLIRQFTSSYKTVTVNQTVIPIGIPQFSMELDVLNCFINGMKLIQGVDYTKDSNTQITLTKPIDIVGTQIEFEIFKSVDGSEAETVIGQVEDLQADMIAVKKDKADKKWYKTVLMVADWTLNSSDGYFHCNSPINGVGADDIIIVTPSPQSVESYAGVYADTQSDGYVGFKTKVKPTTTLYVDIVDLGTGVLS